MALDVLKAIRFTQYYARETDWPADLDKVRGVLGFTNRYPTAKEFVTAVHGWQRAHPPLDDDGILGPLTWKSMSPSVKAYNGGGTPTGPRPDWLKFVKASPAAPQTAAKSVAPPPPPSRTPLVAEDRLIKEWAEVSVELGEDPLTPVPVSGPYVADAARNAGWGLPVVQPVRMIVPPLRVGQIWPGLRGGTRIILAIIPYRPKSGPLVYFITDSGRAYVQPLVGWEHDYESSVWANVSDSLSAIQTLLDVEAKFLLGVISALHPAAAAYVFTMSTLQWIMQNKRPLGKIRDALPDIARLLGRIRGIAPTLFDKLLWKLAKNSVAAIPESVLSDPKIVAFMIGQLLVSLGKLVWKRDCSVFVEMLVPLSKQVMTAAAQAAKAAVKPVAVAAVKGVPGAVKASAQELAADTRKAGVALLGSDAEKIIQEIAKNPQEIKKLIDQLNTAVTGVVEALGQLT